MNALTSLRHPHRFETHTRIVECIVAASILWASILNPAHGAQLGATTDTPWAKPVDGLTCRVIVKPRYVVGQPISAVFEIKNVSDRTRYLVPQLNPQRNDNIQLEIVHQNGSELGQARIGSLALETGSFEPLRPNEVRRCEVLDLFALLGTLEHRKRSPAPKLADGRVAKYAVRFVFRSPKVPPGFVVDTNAVRGKVAKGPTDAASAALGGQWANEVSSLMATFELAELSKDDLIVHEWGVFTVFNDSQYANVNRKEEWGSLPSFFYRQFPKERLRWIPSAWDKPIVYFYAKPTPLRVEVKVTFAEGAPVVWWPCAIDPVTDWPGGLSSKRPKPFRSITWDAWIGDEVPSFEKRGLFGFGAPTGPLQKVTEFPLPAACWIRQARLPSASQLTVIGNVEDAVKRHPGALDRLETERFLYYDGLVPARDYLRCEKIDGSTVTLRNRASFDMPRLLVVDRRVKDAPRFALATDVKAGAKMKIEPKAIAAADWPAVGIKAVRQALLEAGLFEAEADALLRIWRPRLLEAEGVTALHILPVSEYERMLPLSIRPPPATRPVRVGLALHPHVELEPGLVERVGKLLRDLDHPLFEPRNAAGKALLEIGPLAISMLRAELQKNPTLEMRRRIESVLSRVDAADWLDLPGTAQKPRLR